MKASILFSLSLTFTFPNKKTIVSPSLQEFLVKLSSERGREPIAEKKNKNKKKKQTKNRKEGWVEVLIKLSMQHILSGVKLKIIGC